MIIDTMALGPFDGEQNRWALVISDVSEAEGARLEAQAADLKMGTGADAVLIFTGCRVTIGGGEPDVPSDAADAESEHVPLTALDLLDGPQSRRAEP